MCGKLTLGKGVPGVLQIFLLSTSFHHLYSRIFHVLLILPYRWLQSLTMEVILSTAFGVKAETQTVENDSITELAKKAMAPHPFIGIMRKDSLPLFSSSLLLPSS